MIQSYENYLNPSFDGACEYCNVEIRKEKADNEFEYKIV